MSGKNYKEHETIQDIQYNKLIYILYFVPFSARYRNLMLFAGFRCNLKWKILVEILSYVDVGDDALTSLMEEFDWRFSEIKISILSPKSEARWQLKAVTGYMYMI